jgi:dTDP-glucose 4,6-dehydratase
LILVTGGAGFIGSNFVLDWLSTNEEPVVNVDALTYAANVENLAALDGDPRYTLVHGDIGDFDLLQQLFATHRPRAVVNFAAESHVDRSIRGPELFIQTNVVGTLRLLEAARSFWLGLPEAERADFRFLHVSTDEVFGSLGRDDPPFNEKTPYAPNNPYSASKASADLLVRAWSKTYGLPTLTTNCSNNYGPFQFPEKLIPLMIINALNGKPIPIYGDGQQIRDWLYVQDHCTAIRAVLGKGMPGETYCIGGENESSNLDVAKAVCSILDELRPRADGRPHADAITFVADRPGHDRRYAIDSSKTGTNLNWVATETFASGLRRTVEWYLNNLDWVARVQNGSYKDWVRSHYGMVSAP